MKGYRLYLIRHGRTEANEKGISYSQSIFTLANELGHVPLHVAEGDVLNFKLTLPSDFTIFRAILHEQER